MSEKRFVKHLNNTVKDTRTKKVYSYASDMVGVLNEQQATIERLALENEDLNSVSHKMTSQIAELIVWKDRYKDKVDEQQATISRLEEENRELRNELSDCEKFRYSIFKRIGELNVERK